MSNNISEILYPGSLPGISLWLNADNPNDITNNTVKNRLNSSIFSRIKNTGTVARVVDNNTTYPYIKIDDSTEGIICDYNAYNSSTQLRTATIFIVFSFTSLRATQSDFFWTNNSTANNLPAANSFILTQPSVLTNDISKRTICIARRPTPTTISSQVNIVSNSISDVSSNITTGYYLDPIIYIARFNSVGTISGYLQDNSGTETIGDSSLYGLSKRYMIGKNFSNIKLYEFGVSYGTDISDGAIRCLQNFFVNKYYKPLIAKNISFDATDNKILWDNGVFNDISFNYFTSATLSITGGRFPDRYDVFVDTCGNAIGTNRVLNNVPFNTSTTYTICGSTVTYDNVLDEYTADVSNSLVRKLSNLTAGTYIITVRGKNTYYNLLTDISLVFQQVGSIPSVSLKPLATTSLISIDVSFSTLNAPTGTVYEIDISQGTSITTIKNVGSGGTNYTIKGTINGLIDILPNTVYGIVVRGRAGGANGAPFVSSLYTIRTYYYVPEGLNVRGLPSITGTSVFVDFTYDFTPVPSFSYYCVMDYSGNKGVGGLTEVNNYVITGTVAAGTKTITIPAGTDYGSAVYNTFSRFTIKVYSNNTDNSGVYSTDLVFDGLSRLITTTGGQTTPLYYPTSATRDIGSIYGLSIKNVTYPASLSMTFNWLSLLAAKYDVTYIRVELYRNTTTKILTNYYTNGNGILVDNYPYDPSTITYTSTDLSYNTQYKFLVIFPQFTNSSYIAGIGYGYYSPQGTFYTAQNINSIQEQTTINKYSLAAMPLNLSYTYNSNNYRDITINWSHNSLNNNQSLLKYDLKYTYSTITGYIADLDGTSYTAYFYKTPNTSHSIILYAVNKDGKPNTYDPATLTVVTRAEVMDKPIITDISRTTITGTIKCPSTTPLPTKLNVMWQRVSNLSLSGIVNVMTTGFTANTVYSFTITGLIDNTEYYIYSASENSAGDNNLSAAVKVCTRPKPITALYTSIYVDYDQPNPEQLSVKYYVNGSSAYTLDYSSNDITTITNSGNLSNQEFIIPWSQYCNTYTIRVYTKNVNDVIDSVGYGITVSGPAKLANVASITSTSNSITVSITDISFTFMKSMTIHCVSDQLAIDLSNTLTIISTTGASYTYTFTNCITNVLYEIYVDTFPFSGSTLNTRTKSYFIIPMTSARDQYSTTLTTTSSSIYTATSLLPGQTYNGYIAYLDNSGNRISNYSDVVTAIPLGLNPSNIYSDPQLITNSEGIVNTNIILNSQKFYIYNIQATPSSISSLTTYNGITKSYTKGVDISLSWSTDISARSTNGDKIVVTATFNGASTGTDQIINDFYKITSVASVEITNLTTCFARISLNLPYSSYEIYDQNGVDLYQYNGSLTITASHYVKTGSIFTENIASYNECFISSFNIR